MPLSLIDETHILDPSGEQIARLQRESFFSPAYLIVIGGGSLYRLKRQMIFGSSWTCDGEGRFLRVSKHGGQTYQLSEGAEDIAQWSKPHVFGRYSLRAFGEPDLKLVFCIFVAVRINEGSSSSIPM